MKGFFGKLFDLDGDGKLDAGERTFDFAAFADLMDEDEELEQEETEELEDDDLF